MIASLLGFGALFALLAIGVPLMAGVVFRVLLNYNAADLTLEGALLAGLLAGPYTGALVGVLAGAPALLAGEFIAMPFAIGCGFAGGGLREACPKEAIWRFTPFVFVDLPKHLWQMMRRLETGWPLVLLLAPIALELLRQMPMTRHPAAILLPRVWALRGNLTAYDAACIALAEAIDAPLLTCDGGLARAPGHRADVVLV